MSDSRSLRAVVFDLDGLMFNTEELYQYVGSEVLRRRGKTFEPELLDRMMGRQPQVALQIMIDFHGLAATPAELAAESEAVFATILDARLECMPGLVELLDALEQHRIPKAIATSSPRQFVTNVLGRFEFEPRFEFILAAEDVVEGKPHPEVYRKRQAGLGFLRRKCSSSKTAKTAARRLSRPAPLPSPCRAGIAAATISPASPCKSIRSPTQESIRRSVLLRGRKAIASSSPGPCGPHSLVPRLRLGTH
jgi:beta-phosphoglucomutase-like phosphatase (HAD superfamily)